MRVNRSLLGWGLFFIVLGAVMLAVRQGLIPEEQAARAWTLWPVLLIAAGAGILLRGTPVEPLAGLASAVTFGLIVGGVIGAGSVPFASCGEERGAVGFPSRSGELGPAAEVEVQLLCGELTVAMGPGGGWSVEGSDDDGSGPEIESDPDRLEIRSPTGVNLARARERWMVNLPSRSRLDLELTVNAGMGRFDLEGADLERLRVVVNAGEATIDLGDVADIGELDVAFNAAGNSRIVLPPRSLTGSIDANAAGGIRLCAPTGAALRLTFSGAASAHNFGARGLVQDGQAWETPGYDAAPARIDLRTQVNAGNIELEPEGACDA